MVVYLTPDHPDAFVDHPKQHPNIQMGYIHECPKCHGHGGWNLMINAYKMPPGYEDTEHNRHMYRHFCSSCSQCNGWGYCPEVETCIHTFDNELSVSECHERNIYHAGNCYHVYECSKCGKVIAQDSSG